MPRPTRIRYRKRTAVRECIIKIHEVFVAAGNPAHFSALQMEGELEAFFRSKMTIHRAKKALGVRSQRIRGTWYWLKPERSIDSAFKRLNDVSRPQLKAFFEYVDTNDNRFGPREPVKYRDEEGKEQTRDTQHPVTTALQEYMRKRNYVAPAKKTLADLDKIAGRTTLQHVKKALGIKSVEVGKGESSKEWVWVWVAPEVLSYLEFLLVGGKLVPHDEIVHAFKKKNWPYILLRYALREEGTQSKMINSRPHCYSVNLMGRTRADYQP